MFQVALEALKELKTINEIASAHEVHPTQVKQWKKQLQEGGVEVFHGISSILRQSMHIASNVCVCEGVCV
jgi:transposase-like protein